MNEPNTDNEQALAQALRLQQLRQALQMQANRVLYASVNRSGAVFMRPYDHAVASLRVDVVRRLRQKGYFDFETFERTDADNPYTSAAAATFVQDYRPPPSPPSPHMAFWHRWLHKTYRQISEFLGNL